MTPWTKICQAPLSMEFSRKNTGGGCHFLFQGLFPTQGLNPYLLHCRWIHFSEPPGKPNLVLKYLQFVKKTKQNKTKNYDENNKTTDIRNHLTEDYKYNLKILEWTVLYILWFYFLANCVNVAFGKEIVKSSADSSVEDIGNFNQSLTFTLIHLCARVQFLLYINTRLLFSQQLGSHQVEE